ncbi:hypothetical protein BOX15_Mlig008655g1 [Macrostomum lignano]|uniref:Fungal lipase-like domain-containing protein n=1 Tax=Macrostomum lignano TaxID=282301 RepID=A0A267DW85_9PLAT|nr:hypothetical protein BOX15_Mlig008655g1 [Macrostomum lignano]
MPGLVLFNRLCCFSSDDLTLPSIALLACHLLQLAGLSSLLSLLASPQRHVSLYHSHSYLAAAGSNATTPSSLGESLIVSRCKIAAIVSAATVGFRILLLLSCCLLEAACVIASCWRCCCCCCVDDDNDNEKGVAGDTRSLGRRWHRCGTAMTRLVKTRLFLLVLEIAWHLISLPVLALLLLPWSLLQHLPEKISQLKDCSDRSVSVRLLAAVSAIDWTVALLISGALICLLHRLGCDPCRWRRLGARKHDRRGKKLIDSRSCYHDNLIDADGDNCDSNKKLPGQLPPLPPPPPTSIRRRQLCCPPFTSRSTSSSLPFGLTDAALRLTPLFADLNLVASDLAAGLVLLRRQQRLRQRSELSEGSKRVLDYMSGRPIYSATRFFNLANPTDRIEIELALYCAKLILVAEACCCHGNRSVTGAVRHSLNRQGVSDARFRLTYASRNCFAGYDAFTRNIFVVVAPSVTVASSTTTSASSTLRMPSMSELESGVAPIPLPAGVDGGAEWLGHAGSIGAAIQLGAELARHRVLETAAAAAGDVNVESSFVEVMLTGHGVGGGAAVILTLMALARGEAWASRSRVTALAPPGGLLGREAATLARRFSTAVVIGRDAVARLGLAQVATLRRRMVRLLNGCRAHRWSVIGGHWLASRRLSLCCCNSRHKQLQESEDTLNASPGDELADTNAAMSSSDSASPRTYPALQLPGRVLHVVRARNTDGKPVFHALKADGTDFDEILASPSMLRDHSLGYAQFALAAVLSDYDRLQPSPRGSPGTLRPAAQSFAAAATSIERRLGIQTDCGPAARQRTKEVIQLFSKTIWLRRRLKCR